MCFSFKKIGCAFLQKTKIISASRWVSFHITSTEEKINKNSGMGF